MRIYCAASLAASGLCDVPLPAPSSQWLLCVAEEPVEQRGTGRCSSDRTYSSGLEGNGKVYDYRKLHDDLLDQGKQCCSNRVAHLARQAGFKAQVGYKRRPGSYGGKPSVVIDDTLDRQVAVAAPDTAWVTNIIYIRTHEGFAYLAVVIDLYSRRRPPCRSTPIRDRSLLPANGPRSSRLTTSSTR